jgi:hypothetical protein
VVSDYTDYSYDANGNQTGYAKYDGAGVDGIWFNDDDFLFRKETYAPDF